MAYVALILSVNLPDTKKPPSLTAGGLFVVSYAFGASCRTATPFSPAFDGPDT